MKKLEAVKTGVRLAVGISTAYVVGSVIRNNATVTNNFQKGEVIIGAFVLGSLCAAAAEKYSCQVFDEAVQNWNEAVEVTKSK